MGEDGSESGALTQITKARQALARAQDIYEVLEIRDVAKAASVYAEAQDAGEAANEAKEIQLRAERRAGAFLRELERNHGGDRHSSTFQSETLKSDYAEALEVTGISRPTAHRWQKIADVPAEEFESYIEERRRNGRELTQAGALRLQKKVKKQRKQERKQTIPADLPKRTDRFELHVCDIRNLHERVAAESIDYIITDPPYPLEYVPLYEDLAKFALHALTPGGSLLAMAGQSYLPDILNLMTPYLAYQWAVSYLTPGGQSVQLWQRKVNTFWKPVLWFVKGEYDGDWIGDVARSDVNDNDKRFHEWGQSESGMADLIDRFTYPGDVICDPFTGGGATAVTAVEMGRLFVGADISQDAIDTTAKRLGVVNATS